MTVHRSTRLRDVASGLAASAVLAGIVVGVPAALIALVGWPLPTVAPSADAVITALRYGQIAPDTLLKIVAVGMWCAWLVAVCGIGVEALAIARGTVAATLPAAGGVQQLASRLLATVLLLSSLTARAAAAPPDQPQPSDVPALSTVSSEEFSAGPPRHSDAAMQRRPARAGSATATWEVQRRDSLWTIAERTLGDGRRWRQIRDLNVDRRQPDGGFLRADDPMIQPGWVLELPDDATVADRTDQVQVTRGDSLWSLAAAHLGNGEQWQQIYDRNTDRRQHDGQRLTDPDLIRPGWVLELPATPAVVEKATTAPTAVPGAAADATGTATGDPAEVQEPAPPLARLPVTPSTVPPESSEPAVPDRARPAFSARPMPAEPLPPLPTAQDASQAQPHRLVGPGMALLAAGLVAMLAQRRRRWLRVREAGAALGPVDPEAAELERWLRAMADHDLSRRTGQIVRVLTDQFALYDVDPQIVALRLGERVSLLLSTADRSPPPGITATDDGRTWTLDPRFEMMAPPEDRPPYLPALICGGLLPQGDLLLLNLLHIGMISVDGDPVQVAAAITSWAAELATAGGSSGTEIVVVGRHHHLIEQFPRITIVENTIDAINRVQRIVTISRSEQPSSREAAVSVVVLCAEPLEDAAHDQLADLGADARVAVILTASSADCHRLVLHGDRITLQPSDTELTAPEWLDPEDWDRFGDLLRQPTRQGPPDLVSPPQLLTAALQPAIGVADLSHDEADDTGPLVRVLGPVQIEGCVTPLPPDARELLAVLATSRDGVAVEELAARLWPGQRDGNDRLRAAAQTARDLVGDAALVDQTTDGRYRLGRHVASDLQRFHHLIGGVDHVPSAQQAARMRQALELVRGEPFADDCDWAHADGLATSVGALISDIAHRLAMLLMAFGDLDRADWAIDQGMLANPDCELLVRDRMRVADARGDISAVHALMTALRNTSDGWVTAETQQLYERLTRSPRLGDAPLQDATDLDAS